MSLSSLAAARGLPLHQASSAAEQAQQLAERVAQALNRALSTSATASLALSGGRSPEAFLRQLDRQPVNWSRISLTLVDERWVPDTHADSNAGLVRRCMPTALRSATWYGLYQGGAPQRRPESDAQAASAFLQAWLPLDVVVLGMGPDGHCASLFPEQPGLEARLARTAPALCEAVPGPQQAPRLTLTGAALRTARLQLLAISGEDKYQRLCDAFDGPATQWPVAAFLAPPLEIFYSPEG